MSSHYRSGVVAVIVDEKGLVLVGERSDHPGSWQFPQGGISQNECPEEALAREVLEETGCGKIAIIMKSPTQVIYDLPEELASRRGKKFNGQIQWWFLIKYVEGFGPDLAHASSREFRSFKWITPREAVASIIKWKQPAYQQGLKLLGVEI